MAILIRILLLLLILYLIVRAIASLLPPPKFVIEIRNGKATKLKGIVSPQFVNDCDEIAQRFAISTGKIYGVETGKNLFLQFSSEIPEESHQRFRNSFGVHL